MKKSSSILIVSFILLAVVLSISCSKKDEGKKQGELKKIVIAEATRGEGWLPVYLAQELGYYKDEGFEVQFVTYKDGPLALMGLLSGDAQFCIIGFEPVLMAFEKGQESKVILTTLNNQPYTFVSRKGIEKVSDFKGKVIFAGMPGSAPYYFIRTILKNEGLDPDKDVTFASMEYGAEIAALSKQDIDGAYVRATRSPQVLEAGANILVDATYPEQHRKVYKSDRYEAMVVQVTNSYIEKNPEDVQGFANAVYRAMLWQAGHSDEEVAKKVQPLFPGRTIDAGIIRVLRRCLSSDGLFSDAGYAAVESFCRENDVIKKSVPFSSVIDQSFMEKAKATFH
jgi:NitT/TauT family transport system substrate-binding protein